MSIGRLHILTDFHFQQRLSHAELAERAIAGGADVIQFRQKPGTIRGKLYELQRTAAACRTGGALLIVDDHLDLALAVGAGGVHLGQDDLPVTIARTVLGDELVIGATASNADEARRAEDQGADYIGFGPVFPTSSKTNPAPIQGLRGLEAACRAVEVPVIGIAGMTPERVRSVLEAGAHGVAVMTAVTTAADVQAATVEFRRAVDKAIRS
jgi:thiamine-phosphate pyrophosphorylase